LSRSASARSLRRVQAHVTVRGLRKDEVRRAWIPRSAPRQRDGLGGGRRRHEDGARAPGALGLSPDGRPLRPGGDGAWRDGCRGDGCEVLQAAGARWTRDGRRSGQLGRWPPKTTERACDQALSLLSGGGDLNSRPLRPERDSGLTTRSYRCCLEPRGAPSNACHRYVVGTMLAGPRVRRPTSKGCSSQGQSPSRLARCRACS
jgi:hypothetical protein